MRNLNSQPVDMDVYIWSPGPHSVDRGYHKILGWVKRNAPTATSWGRGEAYGIVEITKGKLTYHICRSLPCNDLSTLRDDPAFVAASSEDADENLPCGNSVLVL
jgi:hypothetical protein